MDLTVDLRYSIKVRTGYLDGTQFPRFDFARKINS